MSFLEGLAVPERRTDRKRCAFCEASAEGCRGHKFLTGRLCCEACGGDHDHEGAR